MENNYTDKNSGQRFHRSEDRVNVGPICLIALTKAILEIAVAGKARPRI